MTTLWASALFVSTVACVLLRPRSWHEGLWAALGALVALCTGLIVPGDVLAVLRIAHEPLLFLLALLWLSKLVARSGLFEWGAAHAARAARGSGRILFRNVFLLGAFTTITLSLDTTALLLTPLVVACVQRLKLPARPYVLACVFVANAGSLLLPVSNLTNLLFTSTFGLDFARYAASMLLPQLVVLASTYWLLRRSVTRDLVAFDVELAGDPAAEIPHARYFEITAAVLVLTLLAYFIGPYVHVPTYAVTFAACGLLAAAALRYGRFERALVTHIAWGLFPFVVGLFLVVRGLERAGLGRWVLALLANVHGETARIFAVGLGSAVLSNVANNLPAALVTRGVAQLGDWSHAERLAALVGLDVGPNFLPFASLASLLVLSVARESGAEVQGLEVLKAGWRVTPWVLLAGLATIALQARLSSN